MHEGAQDLELLVEPPGRDGQPPGVVRRLGHAVIDEDETPGPQHAPGPSGPASQTRDHGHGGAWVPSIGFTARAVTTSG